LEGTQRDRRAELISVDFRGVVSILPAQKRRVLEAMTELIISLTTRLATLTLVLLLAAAALVAALGEVAAGAPSPHS